MEAALGAHSHGDGPLETAPGLQAKSEIRKSRTWWEEKENLFWDPRIWSALTRSVAWRMPVPG